MITIYVDGSSLGNPGNAACKMVIEDGDRHDVLVKDLGFHSNNYAELAGILMGLEYLEKRRMAGELDGSKIQIWSDSRIALGWMINAPTKGVLDYRELMLMIDRIHEIKSKLPQIVISHWQTRAWGEIPADFGNKTKSRKEAK